MLSSALRLEIVSHLELYGTCSIAEVARELGRTPHSLYHHFRKLLDAGIVVVERTRKSGAREEALYAVCGRPVVVRYEPNTASTRGFRAKVAAGCLRPAQRDFEGSMESAGDVSEQPELRRYRMRLDPASVAKIQSHLDAVVEIILHERVTAAKSGADTRWYTWVSMMAPQDKAAHFVEDATETDPLWGGDGGGDHWFGAIEDSAFPDLSYAVKDAEGVLLLTGQGEQGGSALGVASTEGDPRHRPVRGLPADLRLPAQALRDPGG